MLIIPAIDLKDGYVVRLYKGKEETRKVYSDNPAQIAKLWEKQGAQLIHVVDLDGAFCGYPKNMKALKKILGAINVGVEFGGGVRTEGAVKELIEAGVARVILGTVAFTDHGLLEKIVKKYKDKIIVSVDLKGKGAVALKGWVEDKKQEGALENFAKRLFALGINKIIYTDIERDGTLSGPRVNLLRDYLNILGKYKISVIMAGGVASLQDIKKLKTFEKIGLKGVIVGKALYEGRFSLSEALNLA